MLSTLSLSARIFLPTQLKMHFKLIAHVQQGNSHLSHNVCGLLWFVYQIIVNIVKMCHFHSCLIHAFQIMVAPSHMAFMTGALCEYPVSPGKSLTLCPTKVLCASNNIYRLLKIQKSHKLITKTQDMHSPDIIWLFLMQFGTTNFDSIITLLIKACTTMCRSEKWKWDMFKMAGDRFVVYVSSATTSAVWRGGGLLL